MGHRRGGGYEKANPAASRPRAHARHRVALARLQCPKRHVDIGAQALLLVSMGGQHDMWLVSSRGLRGLLLDQSHQALHAEQRLPRRPRSGAAQAHTDTSEAARAANAAQTHTTCTPPGPTRHRAARLSRKLERRSLVGQ